MKNFYALGFAPKSNLHTTKYISGSKNDELAYDERTLKSDSIYALPLKLSGLVLSAPLPKTKKTSWKRSLFAFATVIVLGVATGIGVGNWYKHYISSQSFDYSNYAIADYDIDTLTVLNSATGLSYSSLDNYAKYGEIASILHSQGKTPESLSAVQNVAIAQYVATTAYNYTVLGVGLIDTLVKQPFSAVKTFDGQNYVCENISCGEVFGNRFDCALKAVVSASDLDTTTLYLMQDNYIPVADERGIFSSKYDPTPHRYTEEEFVELNGSPVYRMLPYIVSDKTLLNVDSSNAVPVVYNGINGYELTLELDNVTSVLRYYRQVKFTGNFDNPPKFSKVTVKIIIDENWNLVHSYAVENYVLIVMNVPADCVSSLSVDYYFNQDNGGAL